MKRNIILDENVPKSAYDLIYSKNMDDVRIGLELCRPHYSISDYEYLVKTVWFQNIYIACPGSKDAANPENWVKNPIYD